MSKEKIYDLIEDIKTEATPEKNDKARIGEVLELITDEILEVYNFMYINENGEDLLSIVDKQDNILLRINKEGTCFTRLGDIVTFDTLDYELRVFLERLSQKQGEIDGQFAEIEDSIEHANEEIGRLSSILGIKADDDIFKLVDSESNILVRIDYQGRFHANIADNLVSYDSLNSGLKELLVFLTSSVSTMQSDYLHMLTDNENNILEYTRQDGVKVIPKLKVVEFIETEVGKGQNSVGDGKKLHVSRPEGLPRLNIKGLLPLEKGRNKKVEIEFVGFDSLPFTKYAEMGVQGTSSAYLPKKNWSFDFYNDEAHLSSFKLRVGDWVYQDSFHCKANYINITQANNVVGAQLSHSVYETRPFARKRPWRRTYDLASNDFYRDFDLNARGVIDGFPIQIYNNDEYLGLYTFNLKKHRDNMHMKKDVKTNIHLDVINKALKFNNGFIASDWELRNPKLAGYEEGGEITDAETLSYLNRWFDWAKTTTSANIRATADEYIDVDYFIDYILIMNFIGGYDNGANNIQFCSWEGKRFMPMPYDMDQTFGFVGWQSGTYKFVPPTTSVLWTNGMCDKIIVAYAPEIGTRYAELRKKGIFTVEHVESLFAGIMNKIGHDAYKQEIAKWTSIPSNSEVIESLPRILDWVEKRIAHLDTTYKYN